MLVYLMVLFKRIAKKKRKIKYSSIYIYIYLLFCKPYIYYIFVFMLYLNYIVFINEEREENCEHRAFTRMPKKNT